MESGDTLSINTELPNRRVTRQSTKESGFDLKPREPLRRKRRNAEPPTGSVTAVNGSETQERRQSSNDDEDSDDDEPPKKRQSMHLTEDEDADADMEVADGDDQGSDEEDEMNSGDPQPAKLIRESSVRLVPLRNVPLGTDVGVQLQVGGALRSRRSIHPSRANTEAMKHSTGSSKRDSVASVTPITLAPSRTEGHTVKSSMNEYHRKLQERPSDHVDFARSNRGVMDLNQTSNNILFGKKSPKGGQRDGGTEGHIVRSSMNQHHRTLQGKPSESPKVLRKPKTKTPEKGVSSRIYTAILWLFLLCVSLSVCALAYQRIPWSFLAKRVAWRPRSQEGAAGVFSDHMRALEQRFGGQQEELWRRSRIHLQRHLQTAEPTEPVSVILVAGQQAEKTLRCLALRLATAFSSALNGSVLELDGASLADQDGSQVKLDLDNQLREAFEGDKPAAVIHRLEELPPSSTLIFYRYCDHENAAYKHPLLAFTVLLPQDEVGPEVSLQEVEEMVHGHIHQKFLVPDQPDTFDKMDVNKLSGLWSRISHLVLPVSREQHAEEGGCGQGAARGGGAVAQAERTPGTV